MSGKPSHTAAVGSCPCSSSPPASGRRLASVNRRFRLSVMSRGPACTSGPVPPPSSPSIDLHHPYRYAWFSRRACATIRPPAVGPGHHGAGSTTVSRQRDRQFCPLAVYASGAVGVHWVCRGRVSPYRLQPPPRRHRFCTGGRSVSGKTERGNRTGTGRRDCAAYG